MVNYKFIQQVFFCILAILIFQLPVQSFGRSAFSPRHTGMEPPDSMKKLDNMPGRQLSRTSEGGRGYIDAYGNTIMPQQPQAQPEKKRLRNGAYGNITKKKETATLPLSTKDNSSKLWNF